MELVIRLLRTDDKNPVSVIDSRSIANFLGVEHRALIKLLKQHKLVIEYRFGTVFVEQIPSINGSQKQKTVALLTKDQAISLLGFMRKTDKNILCKEKIVEAFLLYSQN